jgi:hypothetical protein
MITSHGRHRPDAAASISSSFAIRCFTTRPMRIVQYSQMMTRITVVYSPTTWKCQPRLTTHARTQAVHPLYKLLPMQGQLHDLGQQVPVVIKCCNQWEIWSLCHHQENDIQLLATHLRVQKGKWLTSCNSRYRLHLLSSHLSRRKNLPNPSWHHMHLKLGRPFQIRLNVSH